MRHSNSEGLPELTGPNGGGGGGGDSMNQLNRISAKEQDHFNFLNSLRKNLNVDQTKLINLECRMSGKPKLSLSKGSALHCSLMKDFNLTHVPY
jgi:hypothetical protein